MIVIIRKHRDNTQTIRLKLNYAFPNGFVWRQLNLNYPARIYPINEDVKNLIGKYLADNRVEFNSFTNKNSRKRGYIVRGLCDGNDETLIDDINGTLTSHGITGNIQIKIQIGPQPYF